MIISQTPVRVPLGGGGTDLPAYSCQFGGDVLSAAINKYVYVLVRKNFDKGIRFTGYYKKEVVASPEEINNPVVRAVLRFLKIAAQVEIVSIADVPANSGLGTSSSFTVGLLNALHTFRNEIPSRKTLAEEAVHIERVVLAESGGIQDQYIAAYGGFNRIRVAPSGAIDVDPMGIDDHVISKLESRLIFFYTRRLRDSAEMQKKTTEGICGGNSRSLEGLHRVKAIGADIRAALETGNLDRFGALLNEHWEYKKRYAGHATNEAIDRWYALAAESGALGGKLIGAGGGGFLMFYCPNETKDAVRQRLCRENLEELTCRFDNSGTKILINIH